MQVEAVLHSRRTTFLNLFLGLVSPIHCGFLCNEIEDISYIMIEINHVTTLTPPSLSLSLGLQLRL